jgi:uncharacterized protein YbgA (DUF1722 family)/uncharacterized protein YbbK (DUF523 family)
VCPEFELGLGVPRETLRLVRPGRGDSQVRMIAPGSGTEHTEAMLAYSRRRVAELTALDLCGYIVQKGSPSCGMERVKVYPQAEGGTPGKDGRGLFTQVLMEMLPHLPVEEDGRLNDPVLRDGFIVRIFAYRRLRDLFAGRWRIGDLVEFHAREKMLLLAHDRPAYTELGRLVAGAKEVPRAELAVRYSDTFMDALARRSTRRKHTNVLQHMAGHFKRLLSADDRGELAALIASYHQGLVPLIVPITLFNHHIRRHRVEYLARQSYLSPHPRELMLRNHV